MKRLLIIIIQIIAGNAVFAQIPIDSILAIIQREVANNRSKSIIVGIIDANGRQIISAGILSDKNPRLPDGNTIYEIGSITKVFTSLLLADMSLQHQLNLPDPISRFLPKTVSTPIRNGKQISLLSLSTHRAGFPRNAYNLDPRNLDNPFADYTLTQLYEYVSNFKLSRDIDSRWEYSNIGYSLLGHILTLVAHKDFEAVIREKICRPLNMNSTVITLMPALRTNMATGHTEYGKPAGESDFLLAGGGGLRSNVNDLLSFAAANLGFLKSDIMPAMELTHILQAKKDGNDSYTTMGWSLRNDQGKNLLYKDGGTAGYRTFLGIDKNNKFGVVVLSNSNNLITDIGLHILDSSSKIKPYKYPWKLLDTLRATINSHGVSAGMERYQQLKSFGDPSFIFNENQLNYLGNELRRAQRINDAIKVYELNAKEYPKSPLAWESLGEMYRRSNNRVPAKACFEKARSLDPQNPHWSYILGKL